MSVAETFTPSTLQLTARAVTKVRELISEEGNAELKLRVYVTGGGCSGFQYGFSFDEEAADDDTRVEVRDFLTAPLPVLTLPRHTLHAEILQLGVDDEHVRDIVADVDLLPGTADEPAKITFSGVRAELPRADLTGSLTVSMGETWELSFSAQVDTNRRDAASATRFLGTEWLWHLGRADVQTKGRSVRDMLEQARGELDIEGVYHGKQDIPVTVMAKLNDTKGRLGADILEMTLGESSVKGTIWIEESKQDLFVRLSAQTLDLEELLKHEFADELDSPGIEIPDLDWWSSKMRVDAELVGDEIRLPNRVISGFKLSLLRAPEGEQLRLAFTPGSSGRS